VTDVLRKFPGQFESILAPVCQGIVHVKEVRAKAAGIWILGEYCSVIEGVDVILDPFLDSFHDEAPLVQLQILTAMVKLFVHQPEETRDQLQFVLTAATQDANVPDVKNRALMYWRILSIDEATAREIVVFGKETVHHSGLNFDEPVLDVLIKNMGRVAGVLHLVPAAFVSRVKFAAAPEEEVEEVVVRVWRPVKMSDDKLAALSVDWDRTNLYVKLANRGAQSLSPLALAFNTNAVGIVMVGQPKFPEALQFGDSVELACAVKYDSSRTGNLEVRELQLALRTSVGNQFGVTRIPVECATSVGGKIGQDQFREYYVGLQNAVTVRIAEAKVADEAMLLRRNVFVVGRNEAKVYVSFQLPGSGVFVGEVAQQGGDVVAVVKGENSNLLHIIEQSAAQLFVNQ
jgi:hypothetical protein